MLNAAALLSQTSQGPARLQDFLMCFSLFSLSLHAARKGGGFRGLFCLSKSLGFQEDGVTSPLSFTHLNPEVFLSHCQ